MPHWGLFCFLRSVFPSGRFVPPSSALFICSPYVHPLPLVPVCSGDSWWHWSSGNPVSICWPPVTFCASSMKGRRVLSNTSVVPFQCSQKCPQSNSMPPYTNCGGCWVFLFVFTGQERTAVISGEVRYEIRKTIIIPIVCWIKYCIFHSLVSRTVEQPGLSGWLTILTECLYYSFITIDPFSGKKQQFSASNHPKLLASMDLYTQSYFFNIKLLRKIWAVLHTALIMHF